MKLQKLLYILKEYKEEILTEIIYLSFLIITYLLFFYPFFFNQELYSWGTDIYGHLYRVWKVMNYGYVEWTKDWYSGSSLFRFYPPLSSLIAAFFGKIFGSDIIGFKITVLLAMIIGAYGMRFLLKEISKDPKKSEIQKYLLSVLYPIFPFFISNVIYDGGFPRFIALMFLPLSLLGFIYLFKYNDNNKRILASIFISLQVLTHHNTAFVFMFLMIFLFPFFILLRNLSFKEIIKNFVIVGILSLLLTSFWIIPFISELEYSGFIDETKDEIMFKAWSLDIKRVFSLDFTYIYYFGLFFFILGIFGYLISFFEESFREKISSLGFLFAIIILILLSMGYYGPFPQINLISPLSKVLPYRFLDCLGLLTLIGIYKMIEISENLLEKKKTILINLFIFSILLVDVFSVYYKIWYPFTTEYHIKEVLPNYIEALKLFSNNFSVYYESLYQYGTDIGFGSMISYLPVIFNISTINGWYRQGSRSFRINIAPNTILNFNHLSDYFFGSLESSLLTQNVKCILAYKFPKEKYIRATEYLSLLKFEKEFENNYYSLWCWNKNSFITPIHYKQIREYKIGRLFAVVGNPLIIKHLDLLHSISADNIHVFKSLDDLADHENIFAYKIIFLYDYGDYKNPEVWRKLEEFVRRGGILVIDTFRTKDTYSTIFNVTSTVLKIEKRNLYSDKYDILRFDEFSEDFDWYATVYKGDIKPIIQYKIKKLVENEYTVHGYVEVEEYAAIGYKNIGYGYVFFIGLNLPYHIDIKDSVYEKFVFNDIIGRFIPIFPDIVNYRILEYKDGKIKVVVNAKFDSWFIIAQTYNPGWRAKLNGIEIPVYEDEDYGLIKLYIPEGNWILELEFIDRWIYLKYISIITFLSMIGFILAEAIKKLKQK